MLLPLPVFFSRTNKVAALSFFGEKNHTHRHTSVCCPPKGSPSEASPTALLPLFVKREITREQHVSSYTALCLSKNTQAAPWQLTTHSQLSNAAEPPKRPLFIVTRWHFVMQAKHCDLICWDSLLKWKYCTCVSHCCSELIMKRRPLKFLGSRVWWSQWAAALDLQWFVHILIYLPPRIGKNSRPDKSHECTITATENTLYLCKWNLKSWSQAAMLMHHLRNIWTKSCFMLLFFFSFASGILVKRYLALHGLNEVQALLP